ncbi:MAG: hypothetical protein V2A77_00910, partial [Pseudomonadota bacterium]
MTLAAPLEVLGLGGCGGNGVAPGRDLTDNPRGQPLYLGDSLPATGTMKGFPWQAVHSSVRSVI